MKLRPHGAPRKLQKRQASSDTTAAASRRHLAPGCGATQGAVPEPLRLRSQDQHFKWEIGVKGAYFDNSCVKFWPLLPIHVKCGHLLTKCVYVCVFSLRAV